MFPFVSALIFALLLTPAQSKIAVKVTQQDHVPLAEMALYMTRRFISPQTNTVVIMEKCKYCVIRHQSFQTRLLDHFLKNFNALMTLQLYTGKPDDKPWDYNIFIVDSAQAFDELRFNFPKTIHDREFYFFVVLTISTHDSQVLELVMHEIFETCIRFDVLHAVILIQYANGTFGFFTYRMFHPSCLPGLTVERINLFSNGSLLHDHLFPPRLINFSNCSITVAAQVYWPILNYRGDRINANAEHMSGVEGDLLKLIAKILNFRIKLQFANEESTIGLHNDSTGCFAALRSGGAEIVVGGFTTSQPNSSMLSASVVFHQSALVLVVRSGLHFGPIAQLANPFKPHMWGLVTLVLIIAMCAIKFMNGVVSITARDFIMGPRNKNPIFNLIIVYFGNPLTRLPSRNFARSLLMAWILATFFLRNAYQGKMFDSLRVNQRIQLPRSLAEVMEKSYVLLANNYQDFYPVNKTLIMTNMTERISTVQHSIQRYATISPIDTLSYYNQCNRNTSRLTFVDRSINTHQFVMYFRKHSVFKSRLDHTIKALMDAGITSRIYKRHVLAKFHSMNARNEKVGCISSGMLLGLYIIYGILNAIAVKVFCFELLSRRNARIKSILEWCH